jgi:tRNA-2-methylthio-N6-dimethylallyladenosine synthase
MGDRTFYMETMGCQMNVLDSELVVGQLRERGYRRAEHVASADVVLINTCSVRDHAESKALSRLGSLKKPKAQNQDMIIGVIGCMAERDPDGIVAKMPHVDLVCGPGELNKIPALIDEIRDTRNRAIALSQSQSRRSTPLERSLQYDSVEALDLSRSAGLEGSPIQAYVRVQRGCDKFCTFCVVPFTRGPERSRPPDLIEAEVRMLIDRGVKEITLLGQTVNSYVNRDDGSQFDFAQLLRRLDAIDGLERLRFVTSYPGDFTDEILEAMRDLDSVCPYLHLPVQSGSDAVLQRMRRQYSVGEYLSLVDRAREIVPEITLASDFIVGFCGETDAEFDETVALVERCQFKNIFVFKYSQRPATVAAKRSTDDVSDEIKRRRNIQLLDLQEKISISTNRTMIGRTVEVLVEGYSKRAIKAQEAETSRGHEVGAADSGQMVGRTATDRIVVFPGELGLVGRLIEVRVDAATAWTLHGTVVGHIAPARLGFVPLEVSSGGS